MIAQHAAKKTWRKTWSWRLVKLSVFSVYLLLLSAFLFSSHLSSSSSSLPLISPLSQEATIHSKSFGDDVPPVPSPSPENDPVCDTQTYQGDKCFYTHQPQCDTGGMVNFLAFYFCSMEGLHWLALILFIALLLLLFYMLGKSAEDYFCPTLAVISDALRLSPDVAGITILALGNGAPDIFSTFVSVTSSKSQIAIGELTGAGTFVMTIVVGLVSFAAQCKLDPLSFTQMVIFQIFSISFIFFVCLRGAIHLWHSLSFIFLYVLYVAFSVLGNYYTARKKKKQEEAENSDEGESELEDEEEAGQEETVSMASLKYNFNGPRHEDSRAPVVMALGIQKSLGEDGFRKVSEFALKQQQAILKEKAAKASQEAGLWPKILFFLKTNCSTIGEKLIDSIEWEEKTLFDKITFFLLLPITGSLALTIPQVDEESYVKIFNVLTPVFSPLLLMLVFDLYYVTFWDIPLFMVVEVVGIAVAIFLFFSLEDDNLPRYNWVFVVFSFLMSIIWIYLVANELVSLLQTIGIIFNIPQSLLGITVLAWGNSVSDAVADVVVAKQGFPQMAIAACYGGPLFNILIGLGASITFVNAQYYPDPYIVSLNTSLIASFSAELLALLTSIIIVPLSKFTVTRRCAVVLLSVYVLFTFVNVLVQFNVIPNINVPSTS